MQTDLPKLALALEYVDIAAALHLSGGSPHAAHLLAAAGEKLLGDLGRMRHSRLPESEVKDLLQLINSHTPIKPVAPASHAHARVEQTALARLSQMAGLEHDAAEASTAALLRAVWYMLESLGLEALIPLRVQQAVQKSTIQS